MVLVHGRKLVAIGIVAVLVGATSIAMLAPLFDVKEFDWVVEDGLALSLSLTISVHGYSSYFSSFYNRTTNWVNVTLSLINLPSLPNRTTIDEFLLDVVAPNKVLLSENLPPANYTPSLARLLSYLILPVGEWHWLDDSFVDEYTIGPDYPSETEIHYVTRIEDDLFFFQKTKREPIFPNIRSTYWKGLINMSTGLPTYAFYSFSEPYCTQSSFLTIEVTSIEIVH